MNIRTSGPAQEAELFEVLRWVTNAEKHTSLIVCDGISERIFCFSPKRALVLRSGPRRSGTLGSVLIDEGHLPADRLSDVLTRCREIGRRFGESAVDLGVTTYAQVASALRIKVEEEIMDLFFWPGAEFRVLDGEPPEAYQPGRYHAASHACELAPFLDGLLLRVAERREVVGRLPTGREVYRLDDLADLSEVTDGVADLLSEFDGTRLARDVIESSPMRRCPAWDVLLGAIRDGIVKRVPTSEAQPIVDAAATSEIELLEGVLDRAVDSSVARMRLARACERTREISRAAAHWRHAGDEYHVQGELTRAITCFEHCVRLAPTDFAAREKILDIHHRQRAFGRVVVEGRPLADMLVKHNLLNRAKRLLLQLVAIEPRDSALRKQLIAALTGLGEHGVALHHQRELATLLESRGAPNDEVLEVYMRVLAVDASDAKARSCIDRLTGVTAQRRAVVGTVVTTAVLLTAFGGAFVYEAAAREEIGQVLPQVEAKLASNEFKAAREQISSVAAGHRFSVAAYDARGLAEGIEEFEREAARRDGGQDLASVQARADAQREAKAVALANAARAHLRAARVTDAQSSLVQLFEEHPDSNVIRAGGVRAPLHLDVLPDDAMISLDGVELGRGSQLVEYDPSRVSRIFVAREGFAPHEIVIDGLSEDTERSVSLAPPELWVYTGQGDFAATPLIDGDIVVVPGRDRRVTALSLTDGSRLWDARMGFYSDVATQPVRVDKGVVIVTGAGDVVCLNLSTGARIWERSLGIAIEAQPIATRGTDGVVVIAAADGRLMGLAQGDGTTRWNTAPQTIARDTAPGLVDETSFAYVASTGGLAVARLGDGRHEVRPSRDLGLVTTPVIDLGRAWVATRDGTLRMIATQSGHPLQSFPASGGRPFAPCVDEDVAFTACSNALLLAFRADGDTIFRATLPQPAGATPALADGVLYVPGSEGRLLAVDAATGAMLWHLECGAPLRATPAIAAGVLLVPTSRGRLLALRR